MLSEHCRNGGVHFLGETWVTQFGVLKCEPPCSRIAFPDVARRLDDLPVTLDDVCEVGEVGHQALVADRFDFANMVGESRALIRGDCGLTDRTAGQQNDQREGSLHSCSINLLQADCIRRQPVRSA